MLQMAVLPKGHKIILKDQTAFYNLVKQANADCRGVNWTSFLFVTKEVDMR